MKNIKFKRTDNLFLRELNSRVNEYFTENKIEKTGNSTLFLKSTVIIGIYVTAYVYLFFAQNTTALFLSYIVLGIFTIFAALNVAHDAAHNTFSTSKRINNILLYTFDFLGASGYMWRLKHVYSHHPHVNIPDMDGDIKQSNLVRIFPNAPFLNFHQYQYLYMPILYFFYTLHWLLFRDFKDYFDTKISGKPDVQHKTKEYFKLFFWKSFYLFRMIALPYWLLSFSFGQILLGFVLFHFAASFTVALALVSTHIGEDSVYPSPNEDGEMPTSWVRHQIATTCDFSVKSILITHLFGGFNHHTVHHLFPNICHIHYQRLTPILKAVCVEYNMPYSENPSLLSAVGSHLKFLKIRSRRGEMPQWIEM